VLRRKHGVDFLEEDFSELDDIASAANRLQTITDDILSLERIEATARNETLEAVNLNNLVEASYITYRNEAEQKGLAYEFEASSHSAFVLADPVQLREAIHNLIVNAIKYTPSGGRVLLRLDRAGRICRLTVEDNGYGIPSEQLPDLFRPFSRAKTPETQAIEGSGLGLHLVKQIIERYNGEVLVQSVYGEGSVFGFYLPMHEMAAPVREATKRKDTRRGLVNRLIGKLGSI
jgi:signal transduction histidine kinase